METGPDSAVKTDTGPDSSVTTDATPPPDSQVGVAFCPGGKPFFGGGLSGIYQGTATVPAGSFNKAGTYKATLALASVCGLVKGVLLIEQSADLLVGTLSYKVKGELGAAGTLKNLVLSDRYCGGLECMPHLTAQAGLEIFDVKVSVGGGTISASQVAVRSGVSYSGLELPFTALAVTRSLPSTPYAPGSTPLAGVWTAKLIISTEIFAELPVNGDNELTIYDGQLSAWKLNFTSNALTDTMLFPSSILDATHRRVGITQKGIGGTYYFGAVLDGNWLIGVIRDGATGGPSSPEVPTELANDDSLHGIWIGERKEK